MVKKKEISFLCKQVLHTRVTYFSRGEEREREWGKQGGDRERKGTGERYFSLVVVQKSMKTSCWVGGETRREEKRCDFFSLLLSANKIDRTQNVATKNLFQEKRKRKKNERTANTYIYKYTHTQTFNQSKYLELVSINMSIPTNTSKISMTCSRKEDIRTFDFR